MTAPPTEQHVETWPIERLVEYPRNPRKNDKAMGERGEKPESLSEIEARQSS
jgi:hypothetical protein